MLGGLLGGVASFFLGRSMVPAIPGPANSHPPGTPIGNTADARQVTDAFISKIRSGKIDELADDIKNGTWLVSDQEFETFQAQFKIDRVRYAREFGDATGEFEYIREVALSKSLVRLVYLQKYPRDGVLWFFVVYHSQDRWRLVGVSWKEKLAVAVVGLD